MKQKKMKLLLQIFRNMLTMSCVAFGGGFVVISLMKKRFVDELQWLEEEEMMDVTAIAQSSPGPILVNASVLVGYRMAGLPGSLVAALGTIVPPMIILGLISIFYDWFCSNEKIALILRVMRAGVAAVIFDVVITLFINVWKTKRLFYILEFVCILIAVVFLGMDAIAAIIVCLCLGILDAFLEWHRERRQKA